MSDLILNIRVGLWHFQIGKNAPHFRIDRNEWYRGKLGKESPWVEIY